MSTLDFSTDPDNRYLLATLTGEFEPARARGRLDEILSQGRKLEIKDIIMDIRAVRGDLSVLDTYNFSKYVATNLRPDERLVVLGTPEQTKPDKFGENVASNRGANAFGATTLEDALRWLGVKG